LESGIFVNDVAPGSVAANSGIQAGDVILTVGRFRVNTLKEFGYILENFPGSGVIPVGVLRGQTWMPIRLSL
jgi:S1-C subfamily serine protease